MRVLSPGMAWREGTALPQPDVPLEPGQQPGGLCHGERGSPLGHSGVAGSEWAGAEGAAQGCCGAGQGYLSASLLHLELWPQPPVLSVRISVLSPRVSASWSSLPSCRSLC